MLFIATANDIQGIPRLLDRMEVIEISGYTENEKEHIAKEHLIPKQMEANGIEKGRLSIQGGALRKIINNYKEAGVRSLERLIGQIAARLHDRLWKMAKKRLQSQVRTFLAFWGRKI